MTGAGSHAGIGSIAQTVTEAFRNPHRRNTEMATNPQDDYDAVASDIVASSPSSTGKMFGMPCLKNEYGKAFAGYYEGAMVFKLTTPAHAEALALPGSRLFDPSGQG